MRKCCPAGQPRQRKDWKLVLKCSHGSFCACVFLCAVKWMQHKHTLRLKLLHSCPVCLNKGLNLESEVRDSRRKGSWVKVPHSPVTSLCSLIASFHFCEPVPAAIHLLLLLLHHLWLLLQVLSPSGCMNESSKNKSTDWGKWWQVPKRGAAISVAFGVVAVREYANSCWHIASSLVPSENKETAFIVSPASQSSCILYVEWVVELIVRKKTVKQSLF